MDTSSTRTKKNAHACNKSYKRPEDKCVKWIVKKSRSHACTTNKKALKCGEARRSIFSVKYKTLFLDRSMSQRNILVVIKCPRLHCLICVRQIKHMSCWHLNQ